VFYCDFELLRTIFSKKNILKIYATGCVYQLVGIYAKKMKIKNINIKKFKRFTDLSIQEIPETARLIVLVGPNGSGKTSLFEAFNHWYKLKGYSTVNDAEQSYFEKKESIPSSGTWYQNKVSIEFHNAQNPNG
jgi:recombinational DNA repair ATPase RecF